MSKLFGMFAFFFLFFSLSVCIEQNVENVNVERTIDLTSQFVRHFHNISLQNTGNEALSFVVLAIEEQAAPHLSFFEVKTLENELETSFKENVKGDNDKKGYVLYEVKLDNKLEPSAQLDLQVTYVFTHLLTPSPKAIHQQDKQYVIYSDNHFFFSPYKTKSQKTTVKLPSQSTLSNSEEPPTVKKGDTIIYGAYLDVAPFRYSEMHLHFENNKPFITATSLVKEIEVSHWGNVAVEETYSIQHDGAKLKGTFSRYEFQRFPTNNHAVISTITQVLPEDASDVYYRDDIGNITTSHLSESDRGVLLELSPRYPLFGGWKAQFYMGYNLPLSQYLFSSAKTSGVYVLEVPFSTTFDDAVIDDLTVRVILPEGASNIEVFPPFSVDSQSSATHFTYLDTFGRPVIVLEKKNVISEHNKMLRVQYSFGTLGMLREPFLLVSAFFLFFVAIMLYYRVEFKIGATKEKQIDKIQDLLFQLKDIMDERNNIHQALDETTEKYINTSEHGTFNDEKKRHFNKMAKNREKMRKLLEEATSVDAELSKNVQNLNNKLEQKAQLQQKVLENEVKHKEKNIKQGSYEKEKERLDADYKNICDEVDSIIEELTENL